VGDARRRAFLLGWLALLDSLPEVDLGPHLPGLLPRLLPMLADAQLEVRSAAAKLCQVRQPGGRGSGWGPAGEVDGLAGQPETPEAA
jgi:hypothetical protein